jgi:pimeloyl-ACP methyl ester carboxylesterase
LQIVCLHDAGLQSSVFDDLLTELDGFGLKALALDLPGHGRSGSLDSLPSIEAMAEIACWVAEWCQIDRALIVGHGMGALVAIEWAFAKPDSVAALVLCGAGAALEIDAGAIELMRNVTRGKAPRPFDPTRVCKDSGRDLMRRAYMEGIKTDPRATLIDLEASRAWANAFDGKSGAEVGGVQCPVRIVSGGAESDSVRQRSEQLARVSPHSSTYIVDGAAHFLPLENPAALSSLIRDCERGGAEAS